MKYFGRINHEKDLVTKEYVDGKAVSSAISYSNSSSGLSGQTAQAAIDELAGRMPQGIFNVFLEDQTTKIVYALCVNNGILCIIPTNASVTPNTPLFVDATTGTIYTIGVNNGEIFIVEAS